MQPFIKLLTTRHVQWMWTVLSMLEPIHWLLLEMKQGRRIPGGLLWELLLALILLQNQRLPFHGPINPTVLPKVGVDLSVNECRLLPVLELLHKSFVGKKSFKKNTEKYSVTLVWYLYEGSKLGLVHIQWIFNLLQNAGANTEKFRTRWLEWCSIRSWRLRNGVKNLRISWGERMF